MNTIEHIFKTCAVCGPFRNATTAVLAQESIKVQILSWQVFLHAAFQTKQNPREGQKSNLSTRLCLEMENHKWQ